MEKFEKRPIEKYLTDIGLKKYERFINSFFKDLFSKKGHKGLSNLSSDFIRKRDEDYEIYFFLDGKEITFHLDKSDIQQRYKSSLNTLLSDTAQTI